MEFLVFRSRHQLKVYKTVVVFDFIQVMNKFVPSKDSVESLFHNKAVLFDISLRVARMIWGKNPDVTRGILPATTLPVIRVASVLSVLRITHWLPRGIHITFSPETCVVSSAKAFLIDGLGAIFNRTFGVFQGQLSRLGVVLFAQSFRAGWPFAIFFTTRGFFHGASILTGASSRLVYQGRGD